MIKKRPTLYQHFLCLNVFNISPVSHHTEQARLHL